MVVHSIEVMTSYNSYSSEHHRNEYEHWAIGRIIIRKVKGDNLDMDGNYVIIPNSLVHFLV